MFSFQKFAALAAQNVQINLQIQPAADGKLEVNLFPVKLGASETVLIAKSFTATPADLDAGFDDVLTQYLNANSTLAGQLGNIEAEAQAAAKLAEEASKTNRTSKTTGTTSSVKSSLAVKRDVVSASAQMLDENDDSVAGDSELPGATASETSQGVEEQISFTL